jgi:hypothetical protein
MAAPLSAKNGVIECDGTLSAITVKGNVELEGGPTFIDNGITLLDIKSTGPGTPTAHQEACMAFRHAGSFAPAKDGPAWRKAMWTTY